MGLIRIINAYHQKNKWFLPKNTTLILIYFEELNTHYLNIYTQTQLYYLPMIFDERSFMQYIELYLQEATLSHIKFGT